MRSLWSGMLLLLVVLAAGCSDGATSPSLEARASLNAVARLPHAFLLPASTDACTTSGSTTTCCFSPPVMMARAVGSAAASSSDCITFSFARPGPIEVVSGGSYTPILLPPVVPFPPVWPGETPKWVPDPNYYSGGGDGGGGTPPYCNATRALPANTPPPPPSPDDPPCETSPLEYNFIGTSGPIVINVCDDGGYTPADCVRPIDRVRERPLITNALSLVRADASPICREAAAQIAQLLAKNGIWVGKEPTPGQSYHQGATNLLQKSFRGETTIIGARVHFEQDVLDRVLAGTMSPVSFAEVVIHEGMHLILRPDKQDALYSHPGVENPPYPAPFDQAAACVQP